MLLTIDLYEDFVNVEGIAVASVFSFQPSSIYFTEFDSPKSNCLAADYDASLS